MGFDACHPAINLIYFVAVIAGTCFFQHPIFLSIALISAFAYSVKRNRLKAVLFNLCLFPLVVLFGLYYSSYNHFGVTSLKQNFIGNHLTLESLVYGIVLGAMIAGVLMWMSCVHSVFSTDKVIYLFGRVSPRLSLFLAILLRLGPRIKTQARRIHVAQQAIGRSFNQGNLFRRLRNLLRIFSMLVTWTIESMATASESMQSRGSTLRGRTAFSIYRFDNRDRSFVISIFACLTVVLMGIMLRQTTIQYDPRIVFNPITSTSWFFYAGYLILCLLPMGLELFTEWSFRRSRKHCAGSKH